MNGKNSIYVDDGESEETEDIVPETLVSCDWREDPRQYDCAPPGCIGFNGHQVVFHCFRPGQPYISRNAAADKCLISLATLSTGEQACTITYDKPPPRPKIPQHIVCTTERGINCELGELVMEKTIFEAEVQTDKKKDEKKKGEKKKGEKKKGDKKKGEKAKAEKKKGEKAKAEKKAGAKKKV
ncbi:uncharacterized protein [Rhodnius prolixus]|uniref:Uncharacterized protein n=1 Tax=Rhodnius prolixus TaxID=13249 RepID=T1HVV9_RHOPR